MIDTNSNTDTNSNCPDCKQEMTCKKASSGYVYYCPRCPLCSECGLTRKSDTEHLAALHEQNRRLRQQYNTLQGYLNQAKWQLMNPAVYSKVNTNSASPTMAVAGKSSRKRFPRSANS